MLDLVPVPVLEAIDYRVRIEGHAVSAEVVEDVTVLVSRYEKLHLLVSVRPRVEAENRNVSYVCELVAAKHVRMPHSVLRIDGEVGDERRICLQHDLCDLWNRLHVSLGRVVEVRPSALFDEWVVRAAGVVRPCLRA